jgi:hypothetical protein
LIDIMAAAPRIARIDLASQLRETFQRHANKGGASP